MFMVIAHVFVQVKPEYIEAFLTATVENAKTVSMNRVSLVSM